MTTAIEDMETMIATHVENVWPGDTSVLNYYDPDTMVIAVTSSVPKPVDFILYGVIQTILETRTLDALSNVALTLTQRQDLYDDVVDRLVTHRDRIDELIDAITTARPV